MEKVQKKRGLVEDSRLWESSRTTDPSEKGKQTWRRPIKQAGLYAGRKCPAVSSNGGGGTGGGGESEETSGGEKELLGRGVLGKTATGDIFSMKINVGTKGKQGDWDLKRMSKTARRA